VAAEADGESARELTGRNTKAAKAQTPSRMHVNRVMAILLILCDHHFYRIMRNDDLPRNCNLSARLIQQCRQNSSILLNAGKIDPACGPTCAMALGIFARLHALARQAARPNRDRIMATH
jgi:hypothetical protein